LVIEQDDPGFLLFRYTTDGSFAGDTWHETVDHAKEQANFEFGNAVSEWSSVPDDVADPVQLINDSAKRS